MRRMWVSAVRSLITRPSAISRLVSLSNHHHNLAWLRRNLIERAVV